MIHIKRSTDKKFYVTVVGDNGEVLSTSETLNSKQKAYKNINAQMIQFSNLTEVGWQDDTLKKTKIVKM